MECDHTNVNIYKLEDWIKLNISISVSVIDCEDPSDGSIWFVNVNFNGCLKMNSSLKVFQDLSYQVYYMDQKVDRQNFAHSLRNPNALFFFSVFLTCWINTIIHRRIVPRATCHKNFIILFGYKCSQQRKCPKTQFCHWTATFIKPSAWTT